LLAAIDEPHARVGDTITLEGDFADGLVVAFPGGVNANATLLGPNRATVVVPAGATTGRLSVGTGAVTSLPFHATTYFSFVNAFNDNYHQVNYARAMPQYQVSNAATMVTDDYVYVLGGATVITSTPVATDKIVRARINADGALDDFADSGQHLITHRGFAASARVGDTTYLIGGSDDQNQYLDTIESATLKSDGTFVLAAVPIHLTTPRFDPACAVIGHWLYVIGGKDTPTHALKSIERAQINEDGSLGPFALVGSQLVVARYGAASVVHGTTLYVAGGADDAAPLATLEVVPIMPDGSVGASVQNVAMFNTARLDAYATVDSNTLFVIGGLTTLSGGPSSTADVGMIRPNETISTFSLQDPLLRIARGGFVAARVANYLYAIGGTSGGFTLGSIEYADETSSNFAAFDSTPVASLVTARRGHASVVIGHALYVLGGVDANGNVLQTIERAPISVGGTLGAFTQVTGMLSEPCAQASAVLMDGNLYLIGGVTPTAPQGTTHIEQASVASDGSLSAFTFGANPLSSGRYGATAVVIDGHVVLYGGIATTTGAPSTDGVTTTQGSAGLNTFQTLSSHLEQPTVGAIGFLENHVFTSMLGSSTLFDSSTATVSSNVTMSVFSHNTTVSTRMNASAVIAGGGVVILGGTGSDGSDVSSILTSGTADGTFPPFAAQIAPQTLPKPLSGQTSTVLGNHIYTVGGTSNGVVQGAVFAAPFQ
jgi:N-acetylneuraminic acid mutarotase